MAHIVDNLGELGELTREDFTVVSDESGQLTLVIPRIALRVGNEESSDRLVDLLLEVVETWEMLS